jgi:hypothetical protein
MTVCPQRFEASIGNLREGYYLVRLLEVGTIVWSFEPGTPQTPVETVVPDDAAWRTFADTLERLEVFAWQPKYNDRRVLDGTHWHLTCAWSGSVVDTSGANAFPSGFDEFCVALERLLEGRSFR